jgi:putative ABC transport system permease protein
MAGIDSGYENVVNFTMRDGVFMNPSDADGGSNVVVLGSTVADSIFKGTGLDPVGQVIKVKTTSATEGGSLGVPLRIVGVIEPRGSAFFQDQDDQIFIPLAIAQGQLLGIKYLQAINIKVDDATNVDQTIADLNRVLKQRHNIIRDEDADYTIRNQATAIGLLTTITDALSLFLTSMAAVSLIVGGIGILNIMLVTVAERTREIGLRKAVGATNKKILTQFLFESGILTLIGGIIGIIIGAVISYLMALLMRYMGYDWEYVISLWSVLLAVGVSILTGVVFGLYPSYKASKLDPIEALRYE